MQGVNQSKTLADIRTTISTHARSAPRRTGTTYLEAYLLDRERKRLEEELAALRKRETRIEARLAEVRGVLEKLVAEDAIQAVRPAAHPAERRDERARDGDAGRLWKRMPINY